MPYKKLLFLLFIFMQLITVGQKHSKDYTSDTIEINKYIEDCKSELYKNPDKASCYCDTILILSEKANYPFGIFTAHRIKGAFYLNNYDLDLAYAELKKALSYDDIEDIPRNKAIILSNIAIVYRYRYEQDSAIYYMGKVLAYTKENNILDLHAKTLFDLAALNLDANKYIKSVNLLHEAKEEAVTVKDSTLLMFIHNALGILYTRVDNFDLSLFHYNKVIEISKTGQKINLEPTAYSNIGELYFRLQSNYDSAAFYYRLSILSATPHQKAHNLLANSINLGNVFYETKKYDSAQLYYQNVLKSDFIKNFPNASAAAQVNMGLLYLETQKVDSAKKYLNSGYELCDELNILLYKKNALGGLYYLDSVKGNYLNALKHYQELHKTSDSLQVDHAKNKMASLEFEKDIAMQKFNNDFLLRQNEIKSEQIYTQKIFIWISFIGLLITLLLIYAQYRNRKKVKNLHSQLSEKHGHLLSTNEELNSSNEALVQQQAQLKASNITKDKFLAILGHDLKSPFVSLLGMLDILNEDWDEMSDPEKHKIIERLFVSSQDNYQLLEDLLSWGKAQQGQIKPENEQFLVYPKVEQLINLFQNQITNKELNISIDIPTTTELNTDPRLFIQIIQNLVNNAIKYTESGGDITIKLHTTENEIRFCVKDSGIGIPDDKILDIFSLNSNFNRAGTLREKSSGMGLILSKEFAHIINGKLSATSTEGKGSVFSLAFKK